jgi:AcrR family transcriptional regulator
MSSAATPAPRLRRRPQQHRSRQRLEHVLDTADALLAREGAEALTMARVAEAAGVSIGSMYQYFPDKGAIAEELALRYVEEFKDIAAALEPGDDPAGGALDAFAEAFRARPGFRAMWFGGLRTEPLRDVTRPGLQDIAASIARLLAERAASADPERVQRVAAMTVLIADALLRQAFRTDPDGDPVLLEETRTLLRGYVRDQLGVT